MTTKFLSDEFERAIKINVVEKTFPKLREDHVEMLTTYLYGIVQMIATCYDFYRDRKNFDIKLRQNSYKDLRWLLTYLLPYINQSKKPASELRDLEELYSLRYDETDQKTKELVTEKRIEDINFITPRYVFSNIQYGRCTRGSIDNGGTKSLHFQERHLRDNYYLLLDTIKTTRYKLYINWIDIIPFRMDDYSETTLYKDTHKKFIEKSFSSFDPVDDYPHDKIRNSEQIQILNDKLKGLNVEDIYNTISLDLYESVVTYKWLIFDAAITTNTGRVHVLPLISVFNFIVELKHMLSGKLWDDLTTEGQDRFKLEWDRLVLAYEKGFVMGNDEVVINIGTIKTIIKSFIVFFDRKYSKMKMVVKDKKYIPLGKKVRDRVDDYDERMRNVTDQEALTSIRSIEYVHIFTFMTECLQGFKSTWYASRIMNKEKTEINYVQGYTKVEEGLYVSYKNIYNYCKSFVHEEKRTTHPTTTETWFSRDYVRLPRTWAELDSTKQAMIMGRLNDSSRDWFNIRINMLNTLRLIDPGLNIDTSAAKIAADMTKVYYIIRFELSTILFETMISRGTMSYMIAETDITDASVYDISQLDQKKKLIDTISERRFYNGNPYKDNSYYYLTNKPFGLTGEYNVRLIDKPEKCDYFKFCSTVKTAWYVATTFHWIAQLGFCHRFINNRVNYVTGGTGAGKSTQVPKLYMYYLKAIDRIEDPTVIITVPRTNVATGVSNFVSQELAVPLKVIHDDGREQSTENYYVQYKYMADEHTDDGIYPKIRFITDGSVLQDTKDPFIKQKRLIDNRQIYTRSDKYNVVVVDEAHEHNANMDMILTLMKNAVFYNNKMRLVIMSATIDADEPTYRRFYRDVNDNRKYPLNGMLKQHKIDRINTDRRFHISPPDETTRFKIDEFYVPGEDSDQLVRKIINSTTSGDLLLFHAGTREIANSVSALNMKGVLPDDVIALPYHAQLPDHCKRFLDAIDKNLKNLSISKQGDFAFASDSDLQANGDGPYKRCVLVATNIAEASISIATLRYVVDTGLEKTMHYDYERRSNILKTNYITDASRLQRKGRVGRVAPGTVYYTYPEDSLKNNVKQFNISVQDISQSIMLDMLRDLNDHPLFTDTVNRLVSGMRFTERLEDIARMYDRYPPSAVTGADNRKRVPQISRDSNGQIELTSRNIRILLEIEYKNLLTNYGYDLTSSYATEFIEKIVDVLCDHYIANDRYYDYYGDDTQYDYQNNSNPSEIYFSGLESQTLTDKNGVFYIVHPDELVLKRNIAGEIVNTDQHAVLSSPRKTDDYVVSPMSNKIIVFWETLINRCLIGIDDMKRLYRTKIGELLQYCAQNMLYFKDSTLIDMLFYGFGLSRNDAEFEKILNVVAMLNVIGMVPLSKALLDQEPFGRLINSGVSDARASIALQRRMRGTLIKIYGGLNSHSDLSVLNNIASTVDNLMKNKGIEYNLYRSHYINNSKFLGEDIRGIATGFPPNLKGRTKKDMARRSDIIRTITDFHTRDLMNTISEYSQVFTDTCLNMELVEFFVVQREEIRRLWTDMVYDVKNNGEYKDVDIRELRELLKHHRNYMDELKIDVLVGATLMSKPYNIWKKIHNTSSSYVMLFNPHINNVGSIPPSASYIEPIYYQDYVLNLTENLEFRTLGTLTQIKPEWFEFVANIYNPREMYRKLSTKSIRSEKLHLHIDSYIEKTYPKSDLLKLEEKKPFFDIRDVVVPEHAIAVTNIFTTVEYAIPDLNRENRSRIWGILNRLGVGYEDYGKILRGE